MKASLFTVMQENGLHLCLGSDPPSHVSVPEVECEGMGALSGHRNTNRIGERAKNSKYIETFYWETLVPQNKVICRKKMRSFWKFFFMSIICRRPEAADYFRKFRNRFSMHLRPLCLGLSGIRGVIKDIEKMYSLFLQALYLRPVEEFVQVSESSYQLWNGDKSIFSIFLGEFVVKHGETD